MVSSGKQFTSDSFFSLLPGIPRRKHLGVGVGGGGVIVSLVSFLQKVAQSCG